MQLIMVDCPASNRPPSLSPFLAIVQFISSNFPLLNNAPPSPLALLFAKTQYMMIEDELIFAKPPPSLKEVFDKNLQFSIFTLLLSLRIPAPLLAWLLIKSQFFILELLFLLYIPPHIAPEGPASNINFNSKTIDEKGTLLFDYIYGKKNRQYVKKEELRTKIKM